MKRTYVLVAMLILLLAGSFLFAQAKPEAEVKVLAAVTGGKDDAENKLFEEAMEKATGLSITWEKVPSGYDQVLMQKLGAGEAYDLVYINQFQMYSLAKQGALMDLTDRIASSSVYAQNVDSAELEKIRFEGKFYAGFNKLEVFPLVNVNKAITDKVGIDLNSLKTLDDYYQMLKKVKTYMEQKEGRKPYYPFYAYMPDIWDLQPWFSAAGVRRGVFFENGKRVAPYVKAEAKPVWEWLAKLYREGLMDPTSFTGTTGDMRKKMWQSQDIVMDVDWAAWTGLYNNNAVNAGLYPDKVNIVGLPGVLGPDGIYRLEQGGASLWSIPSNAKNPDEAFKILEYMATVEGGLLLSAGIEGHDYVIKDGKLEYTEAGLAHAKDHGAPFPISKNFDLKILGKMNPGVLESVAIGRRDDVEVAPMGFANGQLDARKYYDIMSKWMTECVMGKLSADAAMKGAENELRTNGIID
ncbi:MAG: extracellular solute-binding protein [Spirochaetales bacterium]|nr:extracellular solute-binding protein [Spirochaetales bacterium]